MNKKIKQSILSLTMLSLTLPVFGLWTDNHEINAQFNFNNGEAATIRVDTNLSLNLSQQVVYNLLCLALGVTGSGITYSGIQELIIYDRDENDDNNDDVHLINKIGWWKISIGLIITVGSIITLFQFSRLNKLFKVEIE